MQLPLPQATKGGGHEATHPPAEHTEPVAHLLPHEPQLFGSDCSSTHVAPASAEAHSARGGEQLEAHVPPLQTVPLTQAVPHLPQLAWSDCRSTHCPLQSVEPMPQVCVHDPLMQACPTGHAFPHLPQLFESVWRFWQPVVQSDSPASPQSSAQAPLTHASPVQVAPQAPQLVGSLDKLTHLPLHIDCPVGHGLVSVAIESLTGPDSIGVVTSGFIDTSGIVPSSIGPPSSIGLVLSPLLLLQPAVPINDAMASRHASSVEPPLTVVDISALRIKWRLFLPTSPKARGPGVRRSVGQSPTTGRR
jgi:hypothetical protein